MPIKSVYDSDILTHETAAGPILSVLIGGRGQPISKPGLRFSDYLEFYAREIARRRIGGGGGRERENWRNRNKMQGIEIANALTRRHAENADRRRRRLSTDVANVRGHE